MLNQTVTVVIPMHNAAATIDECLASVLLADRDGLDVDVVVVDDASTDDSCAMVERAAAASPVPIKLVQRHENGGAGKARATGFGAALGEIVVCLDADDRMLPRRLVRQVASFAASPDLVLCGSDFIEISVDHAGAQRMRAVQFPTEHEDLSADLLFYCPVWGGTSAFRHSLLNQVPYPDARVGEDWLFVAQAHRVGRVCSVPEPLVWHHRHPAQTTAAPDALANVLPTWRTILMMHGVTPSDDELWLHAMCSPYLYGSKPTLVPTMRSDAAAMAWHSWAQKLLGMGAPGRVRARCEQIAQTMTACRLLEPGADIVRVF